ncbi:MAG: Unknown protein [uncultured Aureispira sp.]|uniref:Uncharacterized protein n=1 Tax=uncultured Aureispira sp. TaxID=1331704 RepID=A0A6S6U0R8_9BACT|nr:MAG: Unknown protein [uncultured Aureispira sp.]
MTTLNFLGKSVLFFFVIFCFSNCNKEEEIVLLPGEQSDFIVTAASGNEVVLDRTWYRNCIPSASMPNVWSSSQRTLSSDELATTEMFYGSNDCSSDLLMVTVTVAKLVMQENPTPITWVDMDGVTASTAPAGLENVTTANSIKYTIETATMTPMTDAQANLLNTTALGYGLTDWAARVTKDVQPILAQFANPGSATIIVLDNGGEGCVYDGIPDYTSGEEYPSKIGNIPHCGPLHSM